MPDYKTLAGSIADTFRIPRDIFSALVQKESGWNANAIGGAGEVGLTQIKPTTAAEVGYSPFTVEGNLQGGAAYLRKQYDKFGNWNDALAAYNAGPGNIQAGQGYASSVLNMAGISGANTPGTQTIPPASVVPGSAGTGSNPGAAGPVVYIIAIGLILLLVAFGVWGVMKGS